MRTVWELPCTDGEITTGPTWKELPGRQHVVSVFFENDQFTESEARLVFDNVLCCRCTYHTCVTGEMFDSAYGKVVVIEPSEWIAQLDATRGVGNPGSQKLHHFMICFDDGPCYEFACTEFTATVTTADPANGPA
jgi:hypothetical protein